MKAFEERFKQLRKENEYSTAKLGSLLNVSPSTITRWENGNIVPSIDQLYKIAKFFNVSSDYLIGLEEWL